jgi:hypothetical protein
MILFKEIYLQFWKGDTNSQVHAFSVTVSRKVRIALLLAPITILDSFGTKLIIDSSGGVKKMKEGG